MRDVSKQVRLAFYNCLNGNIAVPIYDEKQKVDQSASLFALLSTQQQFPIEENDSTWISKNTIDIELLQKSGSEVSKDDVDDLSNTIIELVIPTSQTTGLINPVNLQFTYVTYELITSRNLSISETESIIQKIIRFVITIIQQS